MTVVPRARIGIEAGHGAGLANWEDSAFIRGSFCSAGLYGDLVRHG